MCKKENGVNYFIAVHIQSETVVPGPDPPADSGETWNNAQTKMCPENVQGGKGQQSSQA